MELYLDIFSGTYEQKVTQLYQVMKQNRHLSGYEGRNRDYDTHYNFTPALLKKRVAATVAYRLTANKELSGVASSERIGDMLAFSNGMNLRGGYADTDICIAVVVASAIWMLDQLKLQGNLEDIYPYLPAFGEDDAFIGIHHPQYDDELIWSIVSLICFRNEERYAELDWKTAPLLSARGTKAPRDAYDAVISLIDSDAILKAKEKYERKVWEFYRLAFLLDIKMQEEQKRLESEIEDLQKSALRPSMMLMRPPQALFESSDPTTEKIQRLKYQLERIENTAWFTEIGIPDSREKTARKFRAVIGEEAAKKLTEFAVDDPFELAFALHILLDEDSLLPWLYYGSLCVTYTIVDQLPFYTLSAEKGKPKLINEANELLYKHAFKGVRWENATDCLGEPIERTFGKNLSQILYYNSHTLYPRVAEEMPELDRFFAEISVENEKERQIYALLIHLLNSTNKEHESLRTFRLCREIEQMTQDDKAVSENEIDISNFEKTIEGLKGRIDALAGALYEETRLKKNAVSNSNHLASENERLRRELADLRDIVFAQQSDELIEISQIEEIKFPVATSGRIVSFGGHPSWIKEMKKLLPNVTFYSPDVVPNKDAIRNAEQVWVQTQYISHAAFYRIESALGENTQLRFFSNQNVRACADKMARALLLKDK